MELDNITSENAQRRVQEETNAIFTNSLMRQIAEATSPPLPSNEDNGDRGSALAVVGNARTANMHAMDGLLERLGAAMPPATYVEQQYEWDRAVATHELGLDELHIWLVARFREKFGLASTANKQHVMVEMIARGHLLLEDPAESMVDIGDIGTHCFLYHSELEIQLWSRRKTANEFHYRRRQLQVGTLSSRVNADMEIMSVLHMQRWNLKLAELRSVLVDYADRLATACAANEERTERCHIKDVSHSSLVTMYENTLRRVQHKISANKNASAKG